MDDGHVVIGTAEHGRQGLAIGQVVEHNRLPGDKGRAAIVVDRERQRRARAVETQILGQVEVPRAVLTIEQFAQIDRIPGPGLEVGDVVAGCPTIGEVPDEHVGPPPPPPPPPRHRPSACRYRRHR